MQVLLLQIKKDLIVKVYLMSVLILFRCIFWLLDKSQSLIVASLKTEWGFRGTWNNKTQKKISKSKTETFMCLCLLSFIYE